MVLESAVYPELRTGHPRSDYAAFLDVSRDLAGAQRSFVIDYDREMARTDPTIPALAEARSECSARRIESGILSELTWTEVISTVHRHSPDPSIPRHASDGR
jgi:hypothetical protein